MSNPEAIAHRVLLDGGWTGWRLLCVRGAGFPADWALRLAAPEAAHAADRLNEREAARDQARRAVLAACETATEQRGFVQKTARKVSAGERVAPAGPPLVERALIELAACDLAVDEAREQLRQVLATASTASSTVLRAFAADERVREALVWQNRSLVHTAVEPLLRKPVGATDRGTRKLELTMASYLQRYCLKNDSIGFFGPVGWARLADEGPPLSARPGRSLLAARRVFFEYWAIDAVAGRLAEDEALRPHLRPRRLPTLRLDGTTLHHPIERSSPLPDEFARALALADGATPAATIAQTLVDDETLGLGDVDEAYAILDELREKKLITWTLEVPPGAVDPSATLRQLVEGIDDEAARSKALATVDRLEQGRASLTRAAGDARALDEAAAALEAEFTAVTCRAATRSGGQSYAGRTLFYEDCRRDLELALGPSLKARLAPPLALLLDVARWYTFEIARRYLARLRESYAQLRRTRPSPRIDYLRFWESVAPLFPNRSEPSEIVAAVASELRRRWSELLDGRNDHSVERLRPLVARAFAATQPGWPSARYHTPDLLIAADSVEAVNRGDALMILGELHVSMHTYSQPSFLRRHPAPEEVVAGRELDLPEPGVAPVVTRAQATRSDHYWLSKQNVDVEHGEERSFRPRDRVVSIGELVVEEENDRLLVSTLDGRHRFDVLAFLEYYLMAESMNHFSLAPAGDHAPRITLDGLVLSRERWRFPPSALAFATVEDAALRFAGARAFRRREGLPRACFVRVPEENKPVYVDFESPIFVENLARIVRRASSVTISEMLPRPDQLWLTDAEGQKYTCEIRIACVDPEPYRPERMTP